MSSTKPWQTAEWKRKREEFLKGKSCSSCGSQINLVIHHLHRMPDIKLHYNSVRSKMIKELVDEGKLESEIANVCPNCGYQSLYERKTVSPKYKCYKCKYIFDEPKKVPTYRLDKETYKKFISEYDSIIREILNSKRDNFFQNEYPEFKDCIVLCSKCHYLKHKGMDICPNCKKAKKIGHKVCWNCFIKTPEGQAYLKYKEEKELAIKEMEEEDEVDDKYFEIVHKAHELEVQGKHEEA